MEERFNTGFDIKLTINRQRVKLDGTARLYLKLMVSGELPKRISLPFTWPIEFFDAKKEILLQRFQGDELHLTYQSNIEAQKSKFWREVSNYLLTDKNFSSKDLVRGVAISEKGKTIGAYMDFRCREREKGNEIKFSTQKHHKSIAKFVIEYNKRDPNISELSREWLDKYLVFLMKKMTYASAWAHLKTIKTYIRDAKNNRIIIHPTAEEFKLQKPESEPVWLERDELDRLLELYNDPTTIDENRYYLRAFLFACFTGLRISDLKRFSTAWIQNNEIVFTPTKARIMQRKVETVKIPIIAMSKQFLQDAGNNKILERSEQKFNKRLKKIGLMAKIEKNLTTHVARHTFGTLLAVEGTPVVVIAKLMGHKKTETTMKYIHIAERARQNEMDKLQSSFELKLHRNVG